VDDLAFLDIAQLAAVEHLNDLATGLL